MGVPTKYSKRDLICGYLIGKGYAHYNQIMRDLDLNNGTVAYNLKVLERSGIVHFVQLKRRKIFYIGKMPDGIQEEKYSDMECAIATEIADYPGIIMNGLSENVGIAPSTASYYVKMLVKDGIVRKKRLGMSVQLYPAGLRKI